MKIFGEIYPIEKDGKIFGLGSNDAGGALVSLLYLFKSIYLSQKMNYNFIIACTAEEEIAGTNGIKSILEKLPKIAESIEHTDTVIVVEDSKTGWAKAYKELFPDFSNSIKGSSTPLNFQPCDRVFTQSLYRFSLLSSSSKALCFFL